MCFKRKKSSVVLYMVVDSPVLSASTPSHIFTVTETKKQAQEYVNKRIVLENKEHFDAWCELRNKNNKVETTWAFYAENIITYKGYYILEINYLIKDIAQIFRTMNGCTPIGCSFDESIELIYMLMNTDSDTLQKIDKIIDKE